MANPKMIIGVVAVIAVLLVAGAAVAIGTGNSDNKSYVHYHGNGGKTTNDHDYYKSTDTQVMTCAFVNGDKVFTDYNTKQDGTGTSYRVGAKVTLGTHLYAQWTEPKYELTFEKNERTSQYNISITVNGNTTNVDAGGKFTVAETFTITVKTAGNYSIMPLSSVMLNIYDDASQKQIHFAKPGSIIHGQTVSDATVSADGKTATYKVSNVSPGYGDLGKGIYYHASDFDKRILDGNGGKTTKGESWISVTDAGTYNLPDDKFTLEGKTFNGWNSKADGTGTSYKAGDVLHIGARVYVVWANQQ